MASLQVRGADFSVTKQKALEDAKKMQASVQEEFAKAGKDAPPYLLQELIGKGSFGRVYKATDLNTRALVAVKIIDIEGSDTLNPKMADTYSEFLKEINALKLLRDSGAKNINHVLDALPVGHSMWMVTEYCAGGSVATLMKPTAPGGLQEKWIIPILREVAEAIFWVHKQGIIHRDIKCANVLVTETGAVQLCDFGVAGVIETKYDKRSTFIGTPHWMAPELFDPSASYGTEVDIWAFGSMVFEIASGLPPNVMAGVDITQLGNYLKTHAPRLEDDKYSTQIRNLVAFCLEEDPAKRPTIQEVQRHPYISNTATVFPTSSLADLVKAYKVWEARGGSRKSLFAMGGAQGPSDPGSSALANDEWNFSTTNDFDTAVLNNADTQAVYDVYGSGIEFKFNVETPRPSKPKSRRRPPPQLPAVKAPLEKVFDPNTISNYEENARLYYGKPMPPPAASDLPLRDDGFQSTLRESLIDLDASLHGTDLAQLADMDTLKAGSRAPTDHGAEETPDFNKAPLSDPADLNNNRRTQEWKFPVIPPPPASANPEMSRFPFHEDRPAITPGMTPGMGGRPPLVHHPTEPMELPSQGYQRELMVPRGQDNRASMGSLIDLDEGLVQDNRASTGSLIDLDESLAVPDISRPSTAHSDIGSISGSEVSGLANPFDLERHASEYDSHAGTREPSIYISDDSTFASLARGPGDYNGTPGSSANGSAMHSRNSSYGDGAYSGGEYLDSEYLTMTSSRPSRSRPEAQDRRQYQPRQYDNGPLNNGSVRTAPGSLPPVPAPPSARVMQGTATRDEVRDDMMRMLNSFADHLSFANTRVSGLPVRRARQGGDPDSDQ